MTADENDGLTWRVVRAEPAHLAEWAAMRQALWPWADGGLHAGEAEELYLAGDTDKAAFIALEGSGAPAGFAEAALRRDYVEGCDTSPVGFLEGIYVKPEARRYGLARLLAERVAVWARAQGCTEFASNALLRDRESHAFHAAIGFEETERVVYFRRPL